MIVFFYFIIPLLHTCTLSLNWRECRALSISTASDYKVAQVGFSVWIRSYQSRDDGESVIISLHEHCKIMKPLLNLNISKYHLSIFNSSSPACLSHEPKLESVVENKAGGKVFPFRWANLNKTLWLDCCMITSLQLFPVEVFGVARLSVLIHKLFRCILKFSTIFCLLILLAGHITGPIQCVII